MCVDPRSGEARFASAVRIKQYRLILLSDTPEHRVINEAALAKTHAQLRDARRARVVDDIAQSFPAHSVHTDWLKSQHYRSSYTLPVYRGDELSAFVFFDAVERAAFTPAVTEVEEGITVDALSVTSIAAATFSPLI